MLDLVFLKASNELKGFSEALGLKELIACKAFKSGNEVKETIKDFKLQGIKAIPCNLVEGKHSMKGMLNAANAFNVSRVLEAVSKKGIKLLLLRDAKAIDAGMIALASRQNTAIALLLDDLLGRKGFEQAILLRQWIFVAGICRKYNANLLVFSGARELSGMRKPEDLKAMYSLLGFSRDQANRLAGNAWGIISK